MKNFILLLLIILSVNFAFSQGEIDDDDRIYFRNEKGFGFLVSTTGYGFDYRYAKVINRRNKWLFQGSFNAIRNDKQKKRFVIMTTSLERFVYGKMNSVFNLQFHVGRQREIFQKLDRNSVSVRIFYLLGGTVAFLKPIYYKIGENPDVLENRKFTKATPSHYIYGKCSYFKGAFETKLIPGAIAKVGLSIDFSKKDERFNILEVGFQFEAYAGNIEIMANDKNKFLFPAAFLSYRFGKVFSTHYLKPKKNSPY